MKRTVFSSRVITRPLLQGILLLSVSLFSGQLWAISVSPSTSYNGSFTVSWASANALGCHGVGWGYNCRALQRKIGSGAWTTINTNQGYTSVAYSGYGVATHQYRIYNTTWSYVQDGPVTLQIKNATTPGTPSGPSTSATGSYTITSGVSTGAVRYQIQRRLSGGSWSTYNNGSSRSKAFSQGNGTWQYRSRGCGKTNYTYCSGWSGIRTVNVAITPGVPSSASISPTTSYNGSHTVSWGASSGSITSYQLYRSYNGGSYTHMYTGTATSRSYSSLAVGTYRYRVRAYKTTSSYTSYSGYRYTSTRNVSVPGTPGTPSGPASDADGAYTVSWGAGTGASTYELQERVNSGSWSTVQNTSATSRAVSGKGDGTWTYQVRACSATGCSGWSSTSANIIVALTPGVPASLSASPTSSTNGGHTVSWGAASGTVTAYQLERDIDGGGYSQTYSGTALSQPYTGLADGSYTYRIRACNTVSTVTHCSAYQSASAVSVLNNQLPVVVNDSSTIIEDNAGTVSVLANDSDPDLDTLTVSSVTQGSNGTVTHTTTDVTYTPNANYHGSDSFTYTASDGNGGSATGTVTMTITSVDDGPPVATADSDSTDEDVAKTLSVLSNDSDPDPDPLTISSVTQGTNGAVTHTATDVTYTPSANYSGSDSFSYTVSDGNGGSDTATVSITVTAVNDDPVAVADADTTNEDTATTLTVLSNDSDVENDTLSVSAVTQGTNGSVTHTANDVTYTPNANTHGSDSFTYTVSDGNGGSDTATVNITVTAVNDDPVAVVDADTTNEDTATTITVLANDSDVDNDTLSISSVAQGTTGSVTHTANDVTYTPSANTHGSDSFTYTVSDGNGGSDTATVNITVTAVNDDPVAVADADTTNEDMAITMTVLSNDSDVENDTLSVSAVTQGTNGSVTHTANDVTYTPNADTHGSDSFSYTVSDGNGGSDTATVTVTVTEQNDAPVASNDSQSADEGTALTLSVLSNDSDVDNDTLSITAVTNGLYGTVNIDTGSTTVTYTPTMHHTGTDTFTYTVEDGRGGSDTATVTLTFSGVVPVANDDYSITSQDMTRNDGSILNNDSHATNDTLTITGVTQGTNGTVTFTANKLSYAPNAGFTGVDTFTYTITDSNGDSDTATVIMTVGPPCP